MSNKSVSKSVKSKTVNGKTVGVVETNNNGEKKLKPFRVNQDGQLEPVSDEGSENDSNSSPN